MNGDNENGIIDILVIGEKKYHHEDWERSYIKELLNDDPYKTQ